MYMSITWTHDEIYTTHCGSKMKIKLHTIRNQITSHAVVLQCIN